MVCLKSFELSLYFDHNFSASQIDSDQDAVKYKTSNHSVSIMINLLVCIVTTNQKNSYFTYPFCIVFVH